MSHEKNRHKIILVGESSVGKSSLILRLGERQWDSNLSSTVCMAFSVHPILVRDKIIKLECWDSAGQERYHSIIPMYFRGADAILLVYDLRNPLSHKSLSLYWMKVIQKYFTGSRPYLFLIGNKSDLLSEAELYEDDSKVVEDHQKLIEDIKKRGWPDDKIQSYFTSALENNGVSEMFLDIATKVSDIDNDDDIYRTDYKVDLSSNNSTFNCCPT